jgi:hypothetical protein
VLGDDDLEGVADREAGNDEADGGEDEQERVEKPSLWSMAYWFPAVIAASVTASILWGRRALMREVSSFSLTPSSAYTMTASIS